MTIVQAILIGCVAGLTQIEGGWLGEAKFREPIVTGFLVGIILGDMKTGLIIGAQLQLMWMGAVGIGPTAQLDIGTGGTIGAAIAVMTGRGVETAIMFGVPVAVLMQFLNTLLMTAYSGFMAKVDNDIDEGKFSSISRIHYLCGIISFLMYFAITTIAMYFGNNAINTIVDGLPDWANNGLNAVAALLPCVGFALLMNIIMEKSLIPYFIIGFIPAAFVGFDMNMIGIVSIAVAIALIIFEIRSQMNSAQLASGGIASVDDEWEDD